MRRPTCLRCLLTLTVTLVLVAGGGVGSATEHPSETNPLWSGWLAVVNSLSSGRATHFTNISASWIQPKATCTKRQTFSAFWVGLGTSPEQIGTDADCTATGQVLYYAWYEFVPAPPTTLKITVRPGDSLSASVGVVADNVTVKLRDNTTGAAFSKRVVLTRPDTGTAEWMAEASSACQVSNGVDNNCRPVPLTDFGKVVFTNASASTAGPAGAHTGPINSRTWLFYAPIVLSSSSYSIGSTSTNGANFAQPSSLNAAGDSFAVEFGAEVPSAQKPSVTFTSKPPARSTNTVADFTYATSGWLGDASIKRTCTLDGKAVPCGTYAATLSNLDVGSHTFVVTATSPNGTGSSSDTFVVTKP